VRTGCGLVPAGKRALPEGSMTLQDWAHVAAIVQVVAVAALLYQLYLHTRLTRAANTQRILEVAAPVLLQLAQDAALARLWGAGPEEVARLPEVDRQRHAQLLALWLLVHENVYHQNQHGWINRETYVSWNRELEAFVAQKHLARQWDALRPYFEPSFAAHVSRLVAAPAGRPPP
jgi:hypothetical protein